MCDAHAENNTHGHVSADLGCVYVGQYNPLSEASADPAQQATSRLQTHAQKAASGQLAMSAASDITPSFLTLQFMQQPDRQARLAVRLQRPTIVAEVSFILAVTKFVYPSFAVSGGA